MTDYPSGIYALAEPERLAIRTWDPTNDWYNSYMTNGTLHCIPESKANGWQCVNPRRDYHNDVKFLARRHDGTLSRQDLQTNYIAYADGQTISLQANTNALQVFYGTNLVIDVAHGLTAFTNLYANGLYPHYEFQNNWTTNTYVLIGSVACRQAAAFGPPQE